MRYWLYLAGKLVLAVGVIFGLQCLIAAMFPPPAPGRPVFGPAPPPFMHDLPFTFAIFGLWLVGAGIVAAIVWDHRRRCRVCLRKMILPASSGSWGNMVTLGRPQTELVCPWGHGTLSIEELQITGRAAPIWHDTHDSDIWKELESYQQAEK
ncbi:MAG TPA: hypothetical protein VF283_06050 [Bryobacteraceae bacterium]